MTSEERQLAKDLEAAAELAAVATAGSGSSAGEANEGVLRGCQAHNRFAFQVFVEKYQRLVFAVLSRMLGHGPHVEDLAQETFLRAWRAFPEYEIRADSPPSPWLLTIASRLAISHRRKRSRDSMRREHFTEPSSADTPETERARRALGRAIADAFDRLAPEQRSVFVLQQYHGLSLKEIAVALQISEGTVKSRLSRARGQLKKTLKAYRPSFAPAEPPESHQRASSPATKESSNV